MSARWKIPMASTIVSSSWADRRTYTSWLRGKCAPIPLKVYRLCEHMSETEETSMRNPVALTTPAPWVCLLLALPLAGCGGSSVESKVADRIDESVSSCRAVGVGSLGKFYSCQADGTTVCVLVDGDDVFNAAAQARQAGVAC